MKKLLALFCILVCAAGMVFADDYDSDDEYDDIYIYESNGSGDQMVKIGVMPWFALNFGDKIYPGASAELGYYRFLNKWLAVGGELTITFNMTIGNNALTTVPVTLGVMGQPSFGKFEFPVTLSAGIAYETAQNSSYFPGFVFKAEGGVCYRFSEMWSFGAMCTFMWQPQWFTDSKYNDNAFYMAPSLCARYHL